MRVLALIPARFASTRFPGKPLADIAGKPMIQWVYQRASAVFGYAFVATDDVRIEQAVVDFGGKVIMTSTEHKSGTDRCAEALAKAEELTGEVFDVVVNIQGDEPFIQTEQLRKLIGCFDEERVDIATLVKPFGAGDDIFNMNSPKVVLNLAGDAIYFSRSVIPFMRGVEQLEWAARHTFYKHIGLYAYRAKALREITVLEQSPLELAESLEQLRWIENGYRIRVAITNMETLAVDTPEDLERVKQFAAEHLG
ncbi:MAG: 3-deoxy-manno-octulosonate cytidylyltransferase [Bacteroidales bacterium]|nr:3-deoxy-manno-octulosonate cytidylyltransferase [Bacteroidales bacterium]MBN2751017.1 3-deoxy-manno-octulosonate cytidylyltransferase [Bacteroidales bacterium]